MIDWIDINDTKPELGQHVLAYLYFGKREHDKQMRVLWSVENNDSTVTHWMPLPEPPNATLTSPPADL